MDKTCFIHVCNNCGNKGVLKYISSFEHNDGQNDYDEYGNICGFTLFETTTWFFFECLICHNPILVSEYECMGMHNGESDLKCVYPLINIDYTGVPDNIKTAFESAIRTKGIDYAICLLSLRRTLEMICKDKNAEGKTLVQKIEFLVEQKVLPEMMMDACWIVRQNGNDAAHGDDVIFTYRDVNETLNYVATIINYLYSMPIKIAKLKHSIEKRKSN